MPHLFDNIPPMLKQSLNWVAWGIRGAPLKFPFNPVSLLSGRPLSAKAGVSETWSSYKNAVECVERGLAQGIGYEFDGSVYGVDLDHVIDEAGIITPHAREIVDKLTSYTEVSPSGTGLHIFVLAPGADITRHRKKDHFIEIYNEGRYFTVTGNVYGNVKIIETRTEELQDIHNKFLLPGATRKLGNPPSPVTMQITEWDRFLRVGLERDKAFSALWAGEHRNNNESADDQSLMNKLAYWCNANPDAMIRAFITSPYYSQKDETHKNKCQRPDYLLRTAKNACSTVYSTAIVDYECWQQSRKRSKTSER